MKNLIFTIIIIIISIAAVAAQPMMVTSDAPIVTAGALEEENGVAETMSFQVAKAINADFNGFKIELLTSSTELSENHVIFSQFGKITVEHINGKYCYTIGSFDSQNKATDFASKIIASNYPDYQIVEYTLGVRK